MNNGRMWCVVSPTVGIPLFLGAVALTSLAVHNAVLSNTTWYKDFYSGKAISDFKVTETTKPSVALTAAPSDFTINVTPVAGTSGGAAAFTVTVTPKTPSAAKAELTVATTAK